MSGAEILAALEGLSMALGALQRLAQQARERGEWTSEDEAAFDAKLEKITAQPWWNPEK